MVSPFDVGGTTWNPNDNSDASFGGLGGIPSANLIANFNNTRNTFHSIRSTTNKTSGKWMFVCQIDNMDLVGGWAIGVGTRNANLYLYVGATVDSCGAQFGLLAKQLLTYNPAVAAYSLISEQRDQIAVCVDIDHGFVWWNNLTQRSGWTNANKGDFSGDPGKGVGGTPIGFLASTYLGVYIMGSGYCGNSQFDSLRLNPQCFGYTDQIPFMFSSWDELTIGYTVGQPC